MPTLQEIEAKLTGPGGPFEVVEEAVLGSTVRVFRERPRSLREILVASAGFGDQEYLVAGGTRLTFREHLRRVASVAAALRERFGVGPGDRVAILAANGAEWIVTYWATLSLGAVVVGLNGWWAGDEIQEGLRDSEPRVLVGDRKRLARVAGRDLGVPVVEIESDFASLWSHDPDADLPDVPIAEDDAATILYTSGTTGRPKGAVNTHRGIVAAIRASFFHGVRLMLLGAARGATPAPAPLPPCMLVTTPLFHVSGLYNGAVIPLASGIKTVWPGGRFDPAEVLRLIECERVTTWGPMGTMLHRVLRHPDIGRRDLSSIRQIGSGGAPIHPDLLARLREVFPQARASIGVGYGLTEATSAVTINFGDDLEAHPTSAGRALPTVEIQIRDPEGRALPEGAEGEIHVRTPQVMKEYWRRPADTADAIGPDRWLRTGDVGRLLAGRLFIESRKRDLILRGGENVHPVEIEHCLETHPGVSEACVVGVDHEELGQEVKAIVVPAPGAAPDPDELRRFVAERLAYFKVPAHFELRSAPLPRNAAGKVMKRALLAGGEGALQEE
jgi:acyl-CoA synthetase (AMP-forming)/AMP-acid ligase II